MLSFGSPKQSCFSANHVEQILAAGSLSREEHLRLMSLLLSAKEVGMSERQRINQVFDAVQSGKLQLID